MCIPTVLDIKLKQQLKQSDVIAQGRSFFSCLPERNKCSSTPSSLLTTIPRIPPRHFMSSRSPCRRQRPAKCWSKSRRAPSTRPTSLASWASIPALRQSSFPVHLLLLFYVLISSDAWSRRMRRGGQGRRRVQGRAARHCLFRRQKWFIFVRLI